MIERFRDCKPLEQSLLAYLLTYCGVCGGVMPVLSQSQASVSNAAGERLS